MDKTKAAFGKILCRETVSSFIRVWNLVYGCESSGYNQIFDRWQAPAQGYSLLSLQTVQPRAGSAYQNAVPSSLDSLAQPTVQTPSLAPRDRVTESEIQSVG